MSRETVLHTTCSGSVNFKTLCTGFGRSSCGAGGAGGARVAGGAGGAGGGLIDLILRRFTVRLMSKAEPVISATIARAPMDTPIIAARDIFSVGACVEANNIPFLLLALSEWSCPALGEVENELTDGGTIVIDECVELNGK